MPGDGVMYGQVSIYRIFIYIYIYNNNGNNHHRSNAVVVPKTLNQQILYLPPTRHNEDVDHTISRSDFESITIMRVV